MTQVLNPSAKDVFYPNSLDTNNSLADECFEKSVAAGVNIGELITKSYLMIEESSQRKAHIKLDELEAHEKKFKTTVEFLSNIEAQISKTPDTKEVNLADKSSLVEEMRQLVDLPLLSKTVWNRLEVEALKTGLTRYNQASMQKIQGLSMEVNRQIEQGTELLQIARKCLEMLDRLHQNLIANQRGR